MVINNQKGKEVYFPCQNLATNPDNQFILSPEDWIEAEDQGEITAVVYSHPYTSANQVRQIGLPVKNEFKMVDRTTSSNDWQYCEPCGYKAPLIGRKWVWGVNDCWSLCRDWYAEEFGIELKDWVRPNDPDEFIKNPMFDDCFEETGFENYYQQKT